jgi:siroheme decarboxylase
MMTELQKQLLSIIQTRFPLTPRPFAALAQQLAVTEEDVLAQIARLRQDGSIRRIGAIFDAARLGYVSTLVAAQVPPEILDAFIADVNALPGVSHNYGRAHRYNVWFTLTVPNRKAIDDTLACLRHDHHLSALYSLPARKVYKINVDFDLGAATQETSRSAPAPNSPNLPDDVETSLPSAVALTPFQIALVRQAQQDLPLDPEPFAVWAQRINCDPDAILRQLVDWQTAGVMRRFGAAVRHHQLGFTANAMVVFDLDDDRIDQAGRTLAQCKQVSHCYQRPAAPDWPYRLFAMTHERGEDQLRRCAEEMVRLINPRQHEILFTTAEYKKASVQYFLEQQS